MEVILLERIEKLGQMGDVVKVKDGFARNYLLPQKKALRSNKANLEYFEKMRAELEVLNAKNKENAVAVAKELQGLSVIIVRQASETGHLYGSVTARDVYDAITESGHKIERRHVVLDQPIKDVGVYEVVVAPHPDVREKVVVTVARSQEEAERHVAEFFASAKAASEAVAAEVVAEAEAVVVESEVPAETEA
ncbi:MAG: 50S ribosomal protein L9 [Alphaproteobacteria bacterium]|nr:50S ribosomal protein L9 [Alphaproteobacteria bacterium]